MPPQALRDHLFELRKKGFTRLFQAGGSSSSRRRNRCSISISAARVRAGGPHRDRARDLHQRLVDTIEICYREAGEVIFESAAGGPRTLRFNEKFECKTCGTEFAVPEPILFSFNSPAGACPRCQGFGNTIDFDMDRVIPDRIAVARRRRGGPVDQAEVPLVAGQFPQIGAAARALRVPFCDLTEEEREVVYAFIRRFFDHLETKKYKLHVRVFLSRYRGYALCPECKGARLRKEALYVRVGGRNLAEVVRMNIAEAQQFFDGLELSPEETAIADKILVEIRQRLKFLNDVGLDYLTLDRLASTLSGGEAQRIQLATCLGSRLVGACYVLDEPSIGLHSRDTGG
jgi:excinuclease ABC subunit A